MEHQDGTCDNGSENEKKKSKVPPTPQATPLLDSKEVKSCLSADEAAFVEELGDVSSVDLDEDEDFESDSDLSGFVVPDEPLDGVSEEDHPAVRGALRVSLSGASMPDMASLEIPRIGRQLTRVSAALSDQFTIPTTEQVTRQPVESLSAVPTVPSQLQQLGQQRRVCTGQMSITPGRLGPSVQLQSSHGLTNTNSTVFGECASTSFHEWLCQSLARVPSSMQLQ